MRADGHRLGSVAALERLPPPLEQRVHRGRADDRLVRDRERRRVQDERPGLRAAEAAVERDQLLERAALVEQRVVEAADHDVGHVREAVGAPQVLGRVRREARERVLALDAAVGEVVRAARAERDRPVLLGADEHDSRRADARAARGSAAGAARRSPRASGGAAPPCR